MNRYNKTIEKEVMAMLNEKPKRTSGKGLLSPKETKLAETPKQKGSKDFVVSMVADIRRKRLSLNGAA
jgi:hypothetical protein